MNWDITVDKDNNLVFFYEDQGVTRQDRSFCIDFKNKAFRYEDGEIKPIYNLSNWLRWTLWEIEQDA